MHVDDIGQLICQTRKSKKITQAALGAQLGMSRATISGNENGTVAEIGIRKVMAICTVLGLALVAPPRRARPCSNCVPSKR